MEPTLHCPNCTTEMCLMAHPAAWLQGADLQGLMLWECPKCEASLLLPSRNLNMAATMAASPTNTAKAENPLAAVDDLLAPTLDVNTLTPRGDGVEISIDGPDVSEFEFDHQHPVDNANSMPATLDVDSPLGATMDVPYDFGNSEEDREQDFELDQPKLQIDAENPESKDSQTLDFGSENPLGLSDEKEETSTEELSQADQQLEPSELVASENASWKVSATPRRRRQEPSFLRKVVPPVLGGLAAFPIATAIMWYGVGKDIGSTGPFVAQYAPWIVPKHLRGGLGAFQSDGTLGKSNARNKPQMNGTNGSTAAPSANRDDSTPRSGLPSLNKEETSSKPIPDGRKPTVASNASTEPKLPSEDENNSSTSEKMTKSDNGSSSQLDSVSSQESSSEPEPSANLRKTLDKLKELNDSWSTTPDDKRRDALKAFYSNCNELAEQTAAISATSIRAWQKPLEEFGTVLLGNATYGKVLTLGEQGKLPGIAAPKSGDHLLHIQEITVDRQSDAPHHTHSSNLMIDGKPATMMIPDALVKRAIDLDAVPTKCLFAGRVQVDDMGDAIFFVHWLLPAKP